MEEQISFPTLDADCVIGNSAPQPITTIVQLQSAERTRFPWDKLLDLDFKAIQGRVKRGCQRPERYAHWSADERRVYLLGAIQSQLEQREKGVKATTARAEYPETWKSQHTAIVEGWIKDLEKRYMKARAPEKAEQMSGCNNEVDPDDEEIIPGQYIKPEIKRHAREDSIPSQTDAHQDVDVDENADDLEEDTAYSKSKNPDKATKTEVLVKCVACSRGLAIELDMAAFHDE